MGKQSMSLYFLSFVQQSRVLQTYVNSKSLQITNKFEFHKDKLIKLTILGGLLIIFMY